MKKQLLIVTIALLATLHTKGASSSENSLLTLATDLAESFASAAPSQPESNDFSVTGYLDKLGVRPTILPLSREAYCIDNHHEFHAEIGRLICLERECAPLATYLFTAQPADKEGTEAMAHQFAVAQMLMTKLFNPPSQEISSSIARTPSTHRRKILDILNNTSEKDISLFYFASLDNQPNVRSNFQGSSQPAKTAASSHAWYMQFKRKQLSGEISTERETIVQATHERFDSLQRILVEDRRRTLEHNRPGLQARQALIDLANNQQELPTYSTEAHDAGEGNQILPAADPSLQTTGSCSIQ